MPTLPSSIKARIAVLVMALDCDAIRKMVSVLILRPASLSLQPTARSYAGLPSRSTNATAPAIWLSSTYFCRRLSRRFSRSADNPGLDGAAAFGAGWAQTTAPNQISVALKPAIRTGNRICFFTSQGAPLPAANSILYPSARTVNKSSDMGDMEVRATSELRLLGHQSPFWQPAAPDWSPTNPIPA